jgi:hypothetical protein
MFSNLRNYIPQMGQASAQPSTLPLGSAMQEDIRRYVPQPFQNATFQNLPGMLSKGSTALANYFLPGSNTAQSLADMGGNMVGNQIQQRTSQYVPEAMRNTNIGDMAQSAGNHLQAQANLPPQNYAHGGYAHGGYAGGYPIRPNPSYNPGILGFAQGGYTMDSGFPQSLNDMALRRIGSYHV